ncbi:MAG: hypothetical protein KA735_12245 [Burkholderiaceae bacterium]|nr:hypothetical protein [Burkholderiaceae bacterium]
MQNQHPAVTDVIATHPDGRRAVVRLQTHEKSYYQALGPDGFSVGVYNLTDEAESAAAWAWDFLSESPALNRLTLMQLIIDKLKEQYPLATAAVTLQPKDS